MVDAIFRWASVAGTTGVLLLSALAQLSAQATGDFLALQRRVADLYEQFAPAVVRVRAAIEDVDENGEPFVLQSIGTGFFISREGHILTNASVAPKRASRVVVELDGVQYAADHLGADPQTNIALLKAMALPEQFTFLPVQSTPENPSRGTMVMTISSPLEFDPSPALGMVTGVESQFDKWTFPVGYIRINIPPHPGEQGAPVIDLNGRLVGMVVGSLPEILSAYVIPSRAISRVRDDLLFDGQVVFGWLGFELLERADRARGRHVVIEKVIEETPAAAVGIQPGDKLVRMGDWAIRRADDVRTANFYHRVGDYVNLRISRDGEMMDFVLRMVPRPESPTPFQ